MKRLLILLAALAMLLSLSALAADPDEADAADAGPWSSGTFSGLAWRALGPALMSGRVADIAVDPRDHAHWYVAVCSGGVWETHNAGVTFAPIFDGEGSYSIGCVTIDPTDPNVIWVGSGENNSQRSVSYGDGVYKSLDGGKSWTNMGLKDSMHIGEIVVHPEDGNIVYVAAMGPLWGPGGDRGLYKTYDGGASWEKVLDIGENTGIVCLELDPRDPDVIYASAYQRRRHTWTLINGGPEGGLHKSTDGGQTWREINKGLPGGDKGRIGLAVAPKRPDTIYAIVEAVGDKSGFYRSTDAGENWRRMSDYISTSPQYYNEIYVDPHDPDRVYSLDTYLKRTEDGGKTWDNVPLKGKHVDDHAIWFDPDTPDHLLVGCDGGLYETFDRGEEWRFMENLPITQYYRVAVDDDTPFYNVYGGTQDNNTQGGPSRTLDADGIVTSRWFVTLGGDGFEPACEPGNPDIVYSQWQHGNLVRFDRKTGERIDIQPQPDPGEILKWNWDSALLISPHAPARLYFGANKLFRSDDRGDTWTKISGDLTNTDVDRNTLEVMGTVWSIDTVAKNKSTSIYGNIVTIDESPVEEGVLYVGTDDGLVQVTRDGGKTWTRHDQVGKAPRGSYVHDLTADLFQKGVVYCTLDNRKQNDLKPYVYKSTDYGKSWKPIMGDLPERGTAFSIRQDHVDPDLFFLGTEFDVRFTRDFKRWVKLAAGLPTIKVPDLELQRRENDVVLATFGRGFYVLDDYAPLRGLTEAQLDEPGLLFPVRPALRYIPSRLGAGSDGGQNWTADTPPFGAVFTYYLKDGLESLEDQRHAAEKELRKAGEPVYYPTWDALRAEEREEAPQVLLTVRDTAGKVVRRVTGATGSGLHRVAWNLRWPGASPVPAVDATERSPWEEVGDGPLALAGTYTVELHTRVGGVETRLAGPLEFEVRELGLNPLAGDQAAKFAFEQDVEALRGRVDGATREWRLAMDRLARMRVAAASVAAIEMQDRIGVLENRLRDLWISLGGDDTIAGREEATPASIRERLGRVGWGLRSTTMGPTDTQRRNVAMAAADFAVVGPQLMQIVDEAIPTLDRELEAMGAPFSGGGENLVPDDDMAQWRRLWRKF
ncbi:MAG: glycosyl hydrolase [Candidatus Krumholzibacteriia bacterium]